MTKEWRKIYDKAVAKREKKIVIRKSKNIHRIYKKLYKKIIRMIYQGECWESVSIKRAEPIEQEALDIISAALSLDFQGLKIVLEDFGYDRYNYIYHQVSGTIKFWIDEEYKNLPQDN